jgi:PiT family inorganic phosphate transporter
VQTFLLVVTVLAALGFSFTNGFHDAANAIATSVSTRALSPRTALGLAAVANLAGTLLATGVAVTIAKGIVQAPLGRPGLVLALSSVLGAIVWNLLTWYLGLPSSSSHALIGGLVGAGVAAADLHGVKWSGLVDKVVVPTLVSPIIGGIGGYLAMLAIFWIFRRARPSPLNRGFRAAQSVSAAFMAFSHGTQDAQKSIGVITLALVAAGRQTDYHIPLWVILVGALAMSAGTYAGGWRIIRTLGRRVVKLEPPQGFAAEATSATVLLTTAHLGMPISTTHVITTAVMGAGSVRRLSAVRWGLARSIVVAWLLTIPAAAAVAWLVYQVLFWLVG